MSSQSSEDSASSQSREKESRNTNETLDTKPAKTVTDRYFRADTDVRVSDKKGSHEGEHKHKSGSWVSELELVLTCIGYSVGLGNLWRFPYLAYKNGGGVFLIPYIFFLFAVNFPLYYLEMLIGQNSNLSPVFVWDLCPLFRGLGGTFIIGAFFVQVYYNVIMAYALYYVAQVFRQVLPWSDCFSWWGAEDTCRNITHLNESLCKEPYTNLTNCTNTSEVASEQFWRIYVLDLSPGLDYPGTIKWDLALTLLATLTIVCALTIHRHHSVLIHKIKTIYFTALLPFMILIVYFFYVVTLPGAAGGLTKLFVPHWSYLLDVTVWFDAAQQSMYSAGLGIGSLILFGNKTEFSYNTSRCAFISILLDLVASLLSATVTFMVLGTLAEGLQSEFSETSISGSGLVFITIPNAVLNMDVPHLWAFGFFFMLFVLAVDVSVAVQEILSVATHVYILRSKLDSRFSVMLTSFLLFLTGLSCVTNGGNFVVQLLDYFAGGHAIVAIVMIEAIALGWCYGVKRLSKDIETMQGSPPNICMKICWVAIAPVSLIILFGYTMPETSLPPSFDIPYPSYAETIGWTILAIIMLPVPISMITALFQHRKDLRNVFKPGQVWEKAVSENLIREQRRKELEHVT